MSIKPDSQINALQILSGRSVWIVHVPTEMFQICQDVSATHRMIASVQRMVRFVSSAAVLNRMR